VALEILFATVIETEYKEPHNNLAIGVFKTILRFSFPLKVILC
jgi:hypothetical protein